MGATLIAAASAAPEASYGIGIYNPHATSGELIEVGGTTVPDPTASVKAAAADHLAAETLYSGYGGYGGYGKRSAEAWVPDNLAQVPIGGGLCTAVGALAATSVLSFHASPPSSKPSLLLTSKRASARLRLSLGTDGGDTVEPPLPEELLLSDRTLSLPTTLQSRRVPPGA